MKIYEILREDAEDRPHLSQEQLNAVERFADKLWEKLGIDVKFSKSKDRYGGQLKGHFIDQLVRYENNPAISGAELVRLFKKSFEKYGEEIANLPPETEAVIMDLLQKTNLPFVIKQDSYKEPKYIYPKTIMRKPSLTVKGEFVPKGKAYKIGRTD